MKYGIREIADVVFKAKKNGQKVGDKAFAKGQPVIYFDTLKTSSLEGAATTVYATGGKGNPRLVAWDGERTLTFNMEDALISPMGLAILTGAGLITAGDTTETKTETVVLDEDGAGTIKDTTVTKVNVDGVEFTATSGAITLGEEYANETVVVMYEKTVNAQKIVRHVTERILVEKGVDTIILTKPAKTDADIWYGFVGDDGDMPVDLMAGTVGESNGITITADAAKDRVAFVDYYTEETTANTATQVDIEPGKFSGSFYIEGSTLWRDTDGADHPVEIVIPNGKVQSNFTFTMANSGDPSTFSFVVDALADYTEFDKTKKVLAAMQIMEEVI